MKKAVITIILLFLFVMITSCSTSREVSQPFDPDTLGNSPDNFFGRGIASAKDGWIYFSSDGIYKVKADGTEQVKLSEDCAEWINVLGDSLYYCTKRLEDGQDNSKFLPGVFRMDTDGTDKTRIYNSIVDNMLVVGDWIYYTNGVGHLERMKIDGTNQEKVYGKKYGDYIHTYAVYDGCVYFDYGHDVKRLPLNSKHTETIYSTQYVVDSFNINGNWLFYANQEDVGRLYKVTIEGGKAEKVSDEKVDRMYVSDGWIIYTIDKIPGIYKMNLSGEEKSMITSNDTSGFCVVGDWLFFKARDKKDMLYKIRLDGQQLVKADDSSGFIKVEGMEAFIPYMDKFTTISDEASRLWNGRIIALKTKYPPNYIPTIKGKVLIIDKGKDEIEARLNKGLPEAIKPKKPDDVGTVIWIERGEEQIGIYRNTADQTKAGNAFVQTADICIINLDSEEIVGFESLRGKNPAYQIGAPGDAVGVLTDEEIIKYISSLPQE